MTKSPKRKRDLEHSTALVPLDLIKDDQSQLLWWIDFLLREISRLGFRTLRSVQPTSRAIC